MTTRPVADEIATMMHYPYMLRIIYDRDHYAIRYEVWDEGEGLLFRSPANKGYETAVLAARDGIAYIINDRGAQQ